MEELVPLAATMHSMLRLQQISKSYGPTQANRDVTLSVPTGRIVGFVGPNGAGKSTAMRAIMGLVRPDSGTISWDGQPIADVGLGHVGYLPEQRGLYPKMKTLDQVRYFGRLKGGANDTITQRATALLTEMGLGDRLGDPVEKLSHGNQQRVQLAVALVNDPTLLVLDEPFGGLDPVAAQTLEAVLRQQVDHGAGILFSSHQLELVERICDDVVIIADGQIRASGEVNEVRSRFGEYRVSVRVTDPREPLDHVFAGYTAERATVDQVVLAGVGEDEIETVLGLARRSGTVSELHYELPSLGELFGELTARDESPAGDRDAEHGDTR